MIKLEILLFKDGIFHTNQHLAARLYNSSTKELFVIDYPRNLNSIYVLNNSKPEFEPAVHRDSGIHYMYYHSNNIPLDEKNPTIVTLYRDVHMDKQGFREFVLDFQRQFKASEYSELSNNCSDAVEWTISNFFPPIEAVESKDRILRMLLCSCCMITSAIGLGLAALPAPPGIATPSDIFRKAKWLAEYYPKPEPEQTRLIHRTP